MSLSYSGLRTDQKVTLPSVESWGTNMNIQRDPPKSVHTKKKNYVSATRQFMAEIEGEGDRRAEHINVYPRGQNPMASMNYGNASGNQQAKLPYRIIKDGDFRPAMVRPEDLVALSRRNRVFTSAFSKLKMQEVFQMLETSDVDVGVRLKDKLNYGVVSNVYRQVEHPQVVGTSGQISERLGVFAQTNPGANIQSDNRGSTDGSAHTQEALHGNMRTNISSLAVESDNRSQKQALVHDRLRGNVQVNPGGSFVAGRSSLEPGHVSVATPLTGTLTSNAGGTQFTDSDVNHRNPGELQRVTPLTSAQSNAGGLGGQESFLNTDYALPASLPTGGFSNAGTLPTTLESSEEYFLDGRKSDLGRKVSEMYERYARQPE